MSASQRGSHKFSLLVSPRFSGRFSVKHGTAPASLGVNVCMLFFVADGSVENPNRTRRTRPRAMPEHTSTAFNALAHNTSSLSIHSVSTSGQNNKSARNTPTASTRPFSAPFGIAKLANVAATNAAAGPASGVRFLGSSMRALATSAAASAPSLETLTDPPSHAFFTYANTVFHRSIAKGFVPNARAANASPIPLARTSPYTVSASSRSDSMIPVNKSLPYSESSITRARSTKLATRASARSWSSSSTTACGFARRMTRRTSAAAAALAWEVPTT
mmetsp:Transcript_1901/g.7422  ORF Transcript_1901/g.7422 Transcript_1901/m.7422 type:complete len:275 (-) Transcript_1901:238-1062(-)